MNQTRIERIPGDNTYSNYQEANRTFWRQTVLPLVNRTAKALSAWLSPAYDATLDLRPDLDAIEALSPERDALWTRLENSTFLTADEKRAAVGYAPLGDTAASPDPASKFNPHHDDRGRFTFGPGGGDITATQDGPREFTLEHVAPPTPDAPDPSQLPSDAGADNDVELINRRRGGPMQGTPAQELRLSNAEVNARDAIRRVRELDPNGVRPPA